MAISISRDSLAKQFKAMIPMLIVAALAVFLDQLTKSIIRGNIAENDTIQVIRGYFEFSHARNSGAAFGMFRGRNQLFIIISFFAIGFIFLYYRQFKEIIWMKLSLGLILGGAVGNLVDRVILGEVTDFIRIGVRNMWWPSFNIADASVCAGAVMLIIGMLKRTRSVSES